MEENPEKKLEQFTPFTHEEFYNRYYVHRVAASSLVLNSEKEILLVKEIRKGKYIWGLPGGLLEKQESIINGLIREVNEETSVKIKPYGLLGINNWAGKSIFENDKQIQSGILLILVSSYISGEPEADGKEVIETNFFSFEEVGKLGVHTSIKNFYNAAIEKRFIPLDISDFKNNDMYRFTFAHSFKK